MISVLRAGLCDLVMDPGRPGMGAIGMPTGGAADPGALAAANRLAGNDGTLAGLEIMLAGPVLQFPEGAVVALTGARFRAKRASGVAVGWNETLVLAPGETLALEGAAEGCRCWLAVRGGIRVPRVMGSRSTFLPGGFGGLAGRPLRKGDALETGAQTGAVHLMRAQPPVRERDRGMLRVVPGPQAAQFDDAGLAAFFGAAYRVGAASDRRGVRLEGPAVAHARAELPSQAVLPGAVQVPPDGQPIVLGWDGPATGGYPVIAGVAAADLPLLAQLKPGDAVRFETIEADAARRLAHTAWTIEDLA